MNIPYQFDDIRDNIIDDISSDFSSIINNNTFLHRSYINNMGKCIYRYTSLTNLFQILDGIFYMASRQSFSDRYDKGEYSIDVYKICHKIGLIPGLRGMYADYLTRKMILSTHFNVSSWTLNERESFLMWKAYTNKNVGVRIGSTINNLLSSFSIPGNVNLYCSEIIYAPEDNRTNGIDILFKKTKEYGQEQEFRLYLISKEEHYYDHSHNGFYVSINPEICIKSITLSPFLPPSLKIHVAKYIQSSYPFLNGLINYSSIVEY